MEKPERIGSLLLIGLLFLIGFALTACPTDADITGEVQEPWSVVRPLLKATVPVAGMQSVNAYSIVYGEPHEDPRQVIGYQLEDTGRKFYSAYGLMYAIRLVDRDCSADVWNTWCNQTAHHVCYGKEWGSGDMANVYFNPQGYQRFLKPLRDAGISLLYVVVPMSGGFQLATLYRWPLEEWYPWDGLPSTDGTAYRFGTGPDGAAKIVRQMADMMRRFPADGICFDEEYAYKDRADNMGVGMADRNPCAQRGEWTPLATAGGWVDPLGEFTGNNGWLNRARVIGGENLLRFVFELERELGADIVVDNFGWRYSRYIPWKYTFTDTNGDEITVYRDTTGNYNEAASIPSRDWPNWNDSLHKGMIDFHVHSLYDGYSAQEAWGTTMGENRTFTATGTDGVVRNFENRRVPNYRFGPWPSDLSQSWSYKIGRAHV